MAYEKTFDLFDLAIWMQSTREGISLSDIMNRFQVSRRTAERMRDMILSRFPQVVEEIGENCFDLCEKLSSVTIGSGLKHITSEAFIECRSLKTIEIPSTVKSIGKYKDKEFKSVSADDLGIESPEKKEELKAKEEEASGMLEELVKALDGKVTKVVLSQRLKTHPVCLTSEGDITLEMEKVLNAMPTDQKVHAQRVLEINPEHEIFGKLTAVKESGDNDKLKKYAKLLYDQALLIEGISIENPVEFSNLICELM